MRSVWGPIGGGQFFPTALNSLLHQKRIREGFRSLYVGLLPFSPRLRKSLASVSIVLVTNFETRNLLKRAGAASVELFLDCGVTGSPIESTSRQTGEAVTLLWAGRLEPTKGLVVAIRALAECNDRQTCLLVAGSGSDRARMEDLTRELGLTNRVNFLGRIPHEDMPALFQRCDAFLFTSLRDSFGSVVLEAMAHGLPVVTLNHQGMRALFLMMPLSKFLSLLQNESSGTSHLLSNLSYRIPVPCAECHGPHLFCKRANMDASR